MRIEILSNEYWSSMGETVLCIWPILNTRGWHSAGDPTPGLQVLPCALVKGSTHHTCVWWWSTRRKPMHSISRPTTVLPVYYHGTHNSVLAHVCFLLDWASSTTFVLTVWFEGLFFDCLSNVHILLGKLIFSIQNSIVWCVPHEQLCKLCICGSQTSWWYARHFCSAWKQIYDNSVVVADLKDDWKWVSWTVSKLRQKWGDEYKRPCTPEMCLLVACWFGGISMFLFAQRWQMVQTIWEPLICNNPLYTQKQATVWHQKH